MRRTVLLLAVVFLAGCASAPRTEPADLILTGGRVFTGDDARPWAEGVAIRGETIAAVGTDAEVRALAGPVTRVVDLGGRLVIPGINDAHAHEPILQDVAPYMIDEGIAVPIAAEGASKESVLAALRDAAAGAPAGTLLKGELPIQLVFAGITRDDLDAISTAHPIFVAPMGGHSAVLNTPALRGWGIEETAADPSGGWYGRAHGRLDGWLYEHAYWIPQIRAASAVADARYVEVIRAFESEALRLGITSVQTIPFIAPERLDALLAASGARPAEFQPARSLIEEGIPCAIGSDGPLNPFLNMFFAAIHPTNPKEALTVEQSLRAYTRGSAFAEFEEGRKGTLAPGMLADLAVLSQDIFAVPPPQLPATTSVMTIVGGEVVWEAGAN